MEVITFGITPNKEKGASIKEKLKDSYNIEVPYDCIDTLYKELSPWVSKAAKETKPPGDDPKDECFGVDMFLNMAPQMGGCKTCHRQELCKLTKENEELKKTLSLLAEYPPLETKESQAKENMDLKESFKILAGQNEYHFKLVGDLKGQCELLRSSSAMKSSEIGKLLKEIESLKAKNGNQRATISDMMDDIAEFHIRSKSKQGD